MPLPSESRYLWISNTRFVVVESGFVTVASAGPEPSVTKVAALVQSLPGRRMIWEVAPALRCFLLVGFS